MYTTLNRCRACANKDLEKVFDLGIQPLANDFKEPIQERAGYAPLEVMFCPKCTLSQLSIVVRPEVLYHNYPYITSSSQTMLKHFGFLWESISRECVVKSAIEIGSNDGVFLGFLKSKGVSVVFGIDPASNLTRVAESNGIPSATSTFNYHSAFKAKAHVTSCHGLDSVCLVIARHVFCHMENWMEFVQNLSIIADRDTLVCIEVPYVVDTLDRVEFDQIYHEHLSYLSIGSLEKLLKGTQFHLHKIIRCSIHGGSILIMIRRNDCPNGPDASVNEFLENESVGLEEWNLFSERARRKIDKLDTLVANLVTWKKKTVCGFGASAKSTVWINASGISPHLKFITDNTPHKIGRLSPGSHIPIVSQDMLVKEMPDYAIVFSWNYMEEIMSNNQEYLSKGGTFINPNEL